MEAERRRSAGTFCRAGWILGGLYLNLIGWVIAMVGYEFFVGDERRFSSHSNNVRIFDEWDDVRLSPTGADLLFETFSQ